MKKESTEEERPIEVIPDKKYKGMYRLRWADGVESEDMYNRQRASDMLRNYGDYRKAMKMEGNTRRGSRIEGPAVVE